MRRRFILLAFVTWMLASVWCQIAFPAAVPRQEGVDVTNPEAGGEDLRLETSHGPLHLWRPANYDARTAGIVIYIHGYLTSVDQTWTNDRLALQFHDSGRNALFIAIEAPKSIYEDVSWTSLAELLRTVEDRAPYSLPHGPLLVMGHSAAYRTILLWLNDPRVQNVILLDALYTGESEFRIWLNPHPHSKPHRMVIVANDTHRQSNHFARHIYGSARRRGIPGRASNFSPRETQARLLYIRSQYDHYAIVTSGKVIPVLLQISPLKGFAEPKPHPAKRVVHKPAVPKP
jgi:hypothetical protein